MMTVVPAVFSQEEAAALLFEMDEAIQALNRTGADETARRTLVGCYHNLLRDWSEV